MISKKNDCELILIDPNEETDTKPIKILKKMVSNMGAVRYLVEYSNNEQKQETEKFMKENYIELIEDYNYFSVCGCRYDQQTLQQIRLNKQKLQNFETHAKLPQIPNDENYPIFKRQKKNEKNNEKIINNNNTIQKENISITSNSNSKALIENQQTVHTQLIQQKSEPGDQIQQVTLENGIFSVQWKSRQDGTIPYQEFYHYDYLKATAPNLLLQFIEQEFLDKDPKFKQIKRSNYNNKISQSLEQLESEQQQIQITKADSDQKEKDVQQQNQQSQKINNQQFLQLIEENKEGNSSKEKSDLSQSQLVQEQIQKEQQKVIKEQQAINEIKEQKEIKDNKQEIKDSQREQQQQKEQKDAQNNIIIDDISIDQEVIFDSKQTAEKEKQIVKKKGIVPTIRPSNVNNGILKPKKTSDKDNEQNGSDKTVSKSPEKQSEKPVQKQQVTISQPNLLNQSALKVTQNQVMQELDILSIDKGEDKIIKNYEKELEECYSDVEMPNFQFTSAEN